VPLAFAIAAALGVADPGLDLRWTAPADCPDSEVVARRIEQRLGPRLAAEDRLVVDGRIESIDGQYELELELDYNGDHSQRSLSAPHCPEVVDAAVLVTVLAVDPSATASGRPYAGPQAPAEDPPEPIVPLQPAPASEATVEPPHRDGTTSAPARPEFDPIDESGVSRRLRPLQVDVGVGAGPAWGRVPHTSGSVQLRAGLGRTWWRVEVGANYFTPRTSLVVGFEDRGVRVQAWTLGAAAGPRIALHERVGLVLLAGLEAGGVRGAGFGVQDTRSGTRAWFAADLAARVEVRLAGPLHGWIGGDLAVPFWRPSFSIEGRGVVYEANRVAPRALAGLHLRFGG
jgi:hypothetical protein